MKQRFCKTLVVAVLAIFSFGSVYAQNMEQATETFNAAAKALNEDKNSEALEGFRKAMEMATSAGEEGAAMVNDCKGIIPQILLKMGKSAVNNNDLDGAVSVLKEAIAKATEYGQAEVAADAKELIPTVLLADGNKLLNAGSFAEAVKAYEKVLAEDPENATAYLRIGMAKNKLADEAGAIAAFEKAAQLGSEADAKKQLLSLYAQKVVKAYKAKDNAGAYQSAMKAAEYGDNDQVNKIGGIAAFNAKKYDDCITLLGKTKADASVNYYLARAYEAKGNNAKACSYYKLLTEDKTFGEYAKSKVATLCK